MAEKPNLTRFAPTPSGFVHLGNAMSFAITAAVAAKSNAVVLLRIDDLDHERIRPEYIQDVFDTLNQLGIDYSQGPKTAAELSGQWSQTLRTQHYLDAIDQLHSGGHLYSCSCSRKDLGVAGPNSTDHACRNETAISDDQPLRLRLPENYEVNFFDELRGNVSVDLNAQMPDPIIRRRDGIPSYQIASLVDDVEFGVNLVVRGEDLLASTATQMYLAQLLGYDQFIGSKFYHHGLIASESGEKLSKSAGASSLKSMRERGADTKHVYQKLSALLEIEPKANDLESFITHIDLQKLT